MMQSCEMFSSGDSSKDKKRITRNAMGEYIVPPGGKHLTSLADSTPSPNQYLPKIESYKTVGPQHTIAGPHRKDKVQFKTGPADFNVSEDMNWNRKVSVMKGKGTTRPYDIRDQAHVTASVGPGGYHPEGGGGNALQWERGPGWSLKHRHKDGFYPGPPAHNILPVDISRDQVPGSNIYRPDSGYSRSRFRGKGYKQTFGGPYFKSPPSGPGPADHDVALDTNDTPAKSFGEKIPDDDKESQSPGPADYALESYIGKGPAKTIGILPPEDPNAHRNSPAPNVYIIRDTLGRPGASHNARITWRPFSPEEKPLPGPTDYDNTTSHVVKKPPKFSFRDKTKPVYPDILHYKQTLERITGSNPGPGEYEQVAGTFAERKTGGITMGKKVKSAPNTFPAPNQYRIGDDRGRAISFGSKPQTQNKSLGPGPAAYSPQVSRSNVAYSMTPRPTKKQDTETPGPNKYSLIGQTHNGPRGGGGFSFKGRPSPFVYSGRKGTRILEA